MALQANISQLNVPILFFNKDVEIDENTKVYIKIERYTGEGSTCRFILGFYHTIIQQEEGEHDPETNITPVIFHEIKVKLNFPEIPYSFTVNESEDDYDFNVRKQGYEYLKTLPEFEECEDC